MNVKIKLKGRDLAITGSLGVAFVVLKLTGVIDWSWLWVTAPLWLPVAIVVVLFVVWYAFYLCCLIYREIKRRNSNKW